MDTPHETASECYMSRRRSGRREVGIGIGHHRVGIGIGRHEVRIGIGRHEVGIGKLYFSATIELESATMRSESESENYTSRPP